ncbi:MAG: hypothetical protein QOI82_2781 [Actinomycetota bacterium]|jgi:uncharacterized protein (TIGR03089 family)|nr:hypothetical protein [Actinomycetota bacterium]
MTLYDGDARVEVSGATTANWVAKSANLLVDGLGTPDSIGLLLPLHWQAVVLILAGAATSTRVVLAAQPADLAGCGAAFVHAEHAAAALDAGVDDVLTLSGHPLGLPAPGLPALVLDYAREVPSYADHFGGPRPSTTRIEVGGEPVVPLAGVPAAARVLTTLDPAQPGGAPVLLGTLAAGASLVLLRSGDAERVAAAEHVTATAGIDVEGLTRLV